MAQMCLWMPTIEGHSKMCGFTVSIGDLMGCWGGYLLGESVSGKTTVGSVQTKTFIAQVCPRLPTIKGHTETCIFGWILLFVCKTPPKNLGTVFSFPFTPLQQHWGPLSQFPALSSRWSGTSHFRLLHGSKKTNNQTNKKNGRKSLLEHLNFNWGHSLVRYMTLGVWLIWHFYFPNSIFFFFLTVLVLQVIRSH